MAYSNAGTPVFYVDNYLYRKTIGVVTNSTSTPLADIIVYSDKTHPNLVNMSPSFSTAFSVNENTSSIYFSIPSRNLSLGNNITDFNLTGNMKIYFAVLNHNLTTIGMRGTTHNSDSIDFTVQNADVGQILNSDLGNVNKGSTIATYDSLIGENLDNITILCTQDEGVLPTVGCISTGIQYTMPQSPDLDVSMQIDFDGINSITTSGGKSLTNIKYVGNPLWVNGDNKSNPFDIYSDSIDATQSGERRNGRRSWNLKFTYLSDVNLFASNQKATTYTNTLYADGSIYESDDYDGDYNTMKYNIDTDDSFYAQVWNKTLGGALPFIFQPDSNNNDEFYICKFDSSSLSVKQSAYKVYDVSLKIQEVW